MRYFTLTLMLAAGMYGQMPPSPVPNPFGAQSPAVVELGQADAEHPAPDLRQFHWKQSPQPSTQKRSLFPFLKRPAALAPGLHLLPDGKSPAPPTFVPPKPPLMVIAPPRRECAIPLINVPPPEPGAVIRVVPAPEGVFTMREAVPPAPPCDDRKP